ncbi:MAG: ABC-ATPase domain-containing protein [Streptosporangiaceae bacterium]
MTDPARTRGSRPAGELARLLGRLDRGRYGAYKQLTGAWEFDGFALDVERVQSDPFAPPSRLAVRVPPEVAGFPPELYETRVRARALADHLCRLAAAGLRDRDFRVDAGRQEVLERSACRVRGGEVRLRLGLGLPGRGRQIDGRTARRLLCDDLPAAVDNALRWDAVDHEAVREFVACVEDADALRTSLPERGLVAFVADGAVLPRRSGVDDRPLRGDVVRFASPPSMRVEVELPNQGRVSGMGVPEGVTLIVGGGFHGKSTLLRALERGVYDHVPGDGRELVVARADTVKIRAEDGRRVERVDVSAFVGELPTGADTSAFATDNASGSTSQAASLVEAVEAGAGALLLDEDTTATNLMIRDARMQALVAKESEPLTPYVDLVRPLRRDHGVSTVLVMGGSGDYLDAADQVVMMEAFRPRDATERAREIADRRRERRAEAGAFPAVRHRVPDPESVRAQGKSKIQGRGTDTLRYGETTIDLQAVEQLVDPSQVLGVGLALGRLVRDGHLDGERTIAEALKLLEADIASDGADVLRGGFAGDLAVPRRFEIAAGLNRLRTLRVRGFA